MSPRATFLVINFLLLFIVVTNSMLTGQNICIRTIRQRGSRFQTKTIVDNQQKAQNITKTVTFFFTTKVRVCCKGFFRRNNRCVRKIISIPPTPRPTAIAQSLSARQEITAEMSTEPINRTAVLPNATITTTPTTTPATTATTLPAKEQTGTPQVVTGFSRNSDVTIVVTIPIVVVALVVAAIITGLVVAFVFIKRRNTSNVAYSRNTSGVVLSGATNAYYSRLQRDGQPATEHPYDLYEAGLYSNVGQTNPSYSDGQIVKDYETLPRDAAPPSATSNLYANKDVINISDVKGDKALQKDEKQYEKLDKTLVLEEKANVYEPLKQKDVEGHHYENKHFIGKTGTDNDHDESLATGQAYANTKFHADGGKTD